MNVPRPLLFRRILTLAAGAVLLPALAAAAPDPGDPAARAETMLARMTLAEKIGQMVQVDMNALEHPTDIRRYFLGSMLSGGDSDPADNGSATWGKAIEEYESWALETRLRIPLLYGIDAVHGHNNIDGAVIFPHNIGLGATRNPLLVAEVERITALEMEATGIRWAFAPCVAVAQDERWGRTYESFGDAPDLAADLGAAAIRGFQGPQLSAAPGSVLACAKHFLGDGGTRNGVNEGDTVCDEATLRKLYLPPYRAAVAAGVGSIMVSFNSWNGQKMSGNRHLLTDVLKGELGFKGFLVSDWAAIDQLSPDYRQDVADSINAGMDMVMIPNGPGKKNNYPEFIADLKSLVADGKVPLARIDDAVRRILRIKYQMGLFEKPYTDRSLRNEIGSWEHREIARQCVAQSLVLLKNEREALPLSKGIQHLMVVGRAANDIGIQCGGWTIGWQGKAGEVIHGGTTVLAAIRRTLAPTEVTYSPDGRDSIGADGIVVVVGEMPYAEGKGDRRDLRLDPEDAALIARVKEARAPVITVVISGRPLVLGSALDQSDAVLAAWLPGTEGQGVADVLFGDYKTTGKLPQPWPRNNEELAGNSGAGQPLFPFGFGLAD